MNSLTVPTGLLDTLRRHPALTAMSAQTSLRLAQIAQTCSFVDGQVILAPDRGPAQQLYLILRGAIAGLPAGNAHEPFHREAGEFFPVAAVAQRRAVTATWSAIGAVDCLAFDAQQVRLLAETDPRLQDFLERGVRHIADLSHQAAQSAAASSALAEQSFEGPLSGLLRHEPIAVGEQASLLEGLELMQLHNVGSVLVLDSDGHAKGILTRHDLLPKVALRRPPLDVAATRMADVMSHPVHTLDSSARVHEAALLMSRHGIRHVPVTEGGRVVGLVSERDLFVLQKLSLRQLSASLRHAGDTAVIRRLSPRIREFARQLLAQGVQARALTALVSHLNDLLAQRLVGLLAAQHGLDLSRACWVAFGSEGRSEQTIATDQDNGLVLADEVDDAELARWLAFGDEVNRELDANGYPLCKGGIMAGQPACCLRQREWLSRFAHWVDMGTPENLLSASIYFDLRGLAGNASLCLPLHELVATQARQSSRFIRLLAENSLRLKPALTWLGGLETVNNEGGHWLDLKLHGTAIFVDSARLFVLAQGIDELGTRARFEAAGKAMGASESEYDSWASAFEVLQMLRLRIQVDQRGQPGNPNSIDVRHLNEIDRRVLKEALRVAKRLQQRVQMDWLR